ncbi:MAG: peptide-methionine (S)-S-oxide reductase MsrA, partial [Armatimonadetes bacterium]|nr:peptide-methionine (S)-S-oxide reductase MsrA [Armatimonadota bacterium]
MKTLSTRRRFFGVAASLLAAIATTGTAALAAPKTEEAVIAAGCFWSMEAMYSRIKGVKSVEPGYAGGKVAKPSYEAVCTGTTGHAESVRVTYDPSVVSYRQLLEIFFRVAHDPTTRDRQGPDVGSDYRAIVFARDSAQLREVSAYVAELTSRRAFANPIVTELRLRQPFYPAESYHQR